MNNAELYSQYNQLQARDAEEIVQKFNEISRESGDVCNLLDIGSGCGEVLSKVIVEKLKMNFGIVVGTDISKEMVDFAKRNHENDMVKFHCFDVLSGFNPISNIGVIEAFDVVTSFYCLHWIHDLR
jgi:SAM-dependent methyltransferase